MGGGSGEAAREEIKQNRLFVAWRVSTASGGHLCTAHATVEGWLKRSFPIAAVADDGAGDAGVVISSNVSPPSR